MNRESQERGFILIGLLVVIAISCVAGDSPMGAQTVDDGKSSARACGLSGARDVLMRVVYLMSSFVPTHSRAVQPILLLCVPDVAMSARRFGEG